MINKTSKNANVAVGYCRVSTDDQADNGLSLDYQEAQCKKAALNDGYKDVLIIRDEGRSGTSIDKRPGMREVMRLAENKEISAIYVTHSDRMARNVVDHSVIRSIFRTNGVKLNYLNGQSSGDDASSIVADNMFASFNQYHSDNTREKTKQATDAKAKAGYFPTHAPVGYINASNPDRTCEKVAKKIIVPDPKTGPLVTEAFKLYASGRYNGYELNDLMYEKGLVTGSGKKLSPSMLYAMLKNRLYLGEIHWQNIHVIDGKHTPLIDEATFKEAQRITFEKAGNRCRRRKYVWLLNGFVFCPIHNRRLGGMWNLPKGKAYYHCSNRTGCGKYVPKTDLEDQVAEKLKGLEFEPGFISSIIENVRKALSGRRKEYFNANRDLNNQKNACEAKLRVAEESLLDQTLPKDRYNRIATDLNSMLGKLNEKLGALKKAKDVDLDRAEEVMSFTKNIYANYMSLEEGLQKRILDFFFDGFEVVDGVIIKERYRPLFQELVRENLAYIENPKRKTAFVSKGGDAVNVDDELGAYRDLNPD